MAYCSKTRVTEFYTILKKSTAALLLCAMLANTTFRFKCDNCMRCFSIVSLYNIIWFEETWTTQIINKPTVNDQTSG